MRWLLIGQIFISVMGILVDKIGSTHFWYARLRPPLSWDKLTLYDYVITVIYFLWMYHPTFEKGTRLVQFSLHERLSLGNIIYSIFGPFSGGLRWTCFISFTLPPPGLIQTSPLPNLHAWHHQPHVCRPPCPYYA
jgi:hypothetical protein